ncbi:MAG TPA: DnaJ domain-containing protein [Nostocaceae cyanobacterium]|nr:DnaJ domain-containing protein [Nostocaceae cyanobacterium]
MPLKTLKPLPPEWLDLLLDPYAVLGISVNADERQIFKRYHHLAKLLHPDNNIKSDDQDSELAQAVFTNLINPAYEQLKQTKKRLDVLQILRSEAKHLDRQKVLTSPISIAKEMIVKSTQEAELIYEEAIAHQAVTQYKSLEQSYQITKQLCILNLVYLWLPNNESPLITSTLEVKPASLDNEAKPAAVKVADLKISEHTNTKLTTNYAQRHYERALQYTKQQNWAIAVEELRDAIKLEPNNGDYYALLGVVHFQQQLIGMAKVYIRQALKLNPQQPLALKYAIKLNIQPGENANPQSMAKALGIASLLNRFLPGKHS